MKILVYRESFTFTRALIDCFCRNWCIVFSLLLQLLQLKNVLNIRGTFPCKLQFQNRLELLLHYNDCVLDAAIHPICVTFYLLKNIVSVMRWPKYNFTAFHFITFLNPNSFYTMHNLHLSLANFVWILRHKNNFLFSLRQIHVSSIKNSCSSVNTIYLNAWCQIILFW